jgi:hypothetical protein
VTKLSPLAPILAFTLWGCATDHAVKVWEDLERPVLLNGYSDFKGDVDGVDDGYVVVSYQLPASVPTAEVIPRLKSQITTRFPCYQTLDESTDRLVLRCPGGRVRGSAHGNEEYRIRTSNEHRRVFMLVVDEVADPTYPKMLEALDRTVEAYRK